MITLKMGVTSELTACAIADDLRVLYEKYEKCKSEDLVILIHPDCEETITSAIQLGVPFKLTPSMYGWQTVLIDVGGIMHEIPCETEVKS